VYQQTPDTCSVPPIVSTVLRIVTNKLLKAT